MESGPVAVGGRPLSFRANFGDGYPVGRLAQLVEHLVYTERVGGSSPSSPTSIQRCGLLDTSEGLF